MQEPEPYTPELCRLEKSPDTMRPEDRLQLTTSISLIVPLSYMSLRWWLGQIAFSLPLAVWFLVDAMIQYVLILLLRSELLKRSRFTQLSYASAIIVGLPATVLSVFNGLAAEFRLIPLLIHLMLGRHRGRAFYTILLFISGILLLYPFFSGQVEFLIEELFRSVAVLMILIFSIPYRRSMQIRLRKNVRRLRKNRLQSRQ